MCDGYGATLCSWDEVVTQMKCVVKNTEPTDLFVYKYGRLTLRLVTAVIKIAKRERGRGNAKWVSVYAESAQEIAELQESVQLFMMEKVISNYVEDNLHL